LNVANTQGKEINKFAFGCLEFKSYDPRNICKQHFAKIHFQWPTDSFVRPEEEWMKNCYNAVNIHQQVIFVGTSQDNPKK